MTVQDIYEAALPFAIVLFGVGCAWAFTFVVSNVGHAHAQRSRLHNLQMQCFRDARRSVGTRFYASASTRDEDVRMMAQVLFEHRCKEQRLPRHLAPSR